MSDRYQDTDGREYREGYDNGRADARAELMPEIDRLQLQWTGMKDEINLCHAEIERLREEECQQHNHITGLMREIERLLAVSTELNDEIERLRTIVRDEMGWLLKAGRPSRAKELRCALEQTRKK